MEMKSWFAYSVNNGVRWICCAMSKHHKSRPLTRTSLNVLMSLCADSSCVTAFVQLKGFEIISSIMVAFNREEVVMVDARVWWSTFAASQ